MTDNRRQHDGITSAYATRVRADDLKTVSTQPLRYSVLSS